MPGLRAGPVLSNMSWMRGRGARPGARFGSSAVRIIVCIMLACYIDGGQASPKSGGLTDQQQSSASWKNDDDSVQQYQEPRSRCCARGQRNDKARPGGVSEDEEQIVLIGLCAFGGMFAFFGLMALGRHMRANCRCCKPRARKAGAHRLKSFQSTARAACAAERLRAAASAKPGSPRRTGGGSAFGDVVLMAKANAALKAKCQPSAAGSSPRLPSAASPKGATVQDL